jgi:hypothetical protein
MGEAGNAAWAQEIVALMAELISESGSAFADRHGEEGLTVALEIQAALMHQFEGNIGHVVLWEQFSRTPHPVVPAVTSVVRSCMDRDQVLGDWLKEQLRRYRTSAGRVP